MKILPTKWVTLPVSLTVAGALLTSVIACTPKHHAKTPNSDLVPVTTFDGDFIETASAPAQPSASPAPSPADSGKPAPSTSSTDAATNAGGDTAQPPGTTPSHSTSPKTDRARRVTNPDDSLVFNALHFENGEVRLTYLMEGQTDAETIVIGKLSHIPSKKQKKILGDGKSKDKNASLDKGATGDEGTVDFSDKANVGPDTTAAIARFKPADGLQSTLQNKPGFRHFVTDWLADNRSVVFHLTGSNLDVQFLDGDDNTVQPSRPYPTRVRVSADMLAEARQKVAQNLAELKAKRTEFLNAFANVDLKLTDRTVTLVSSTGENLGQTQEKAETLKPEVPLNGGKLLALNPLDLQISRNEEESPDSTTDSRYLDAQLNQSTPSKVRFLIHNGPGGVQLLLHIDPQVDKSKYAHIGFRGSVAIDNDGNGFQVNGYYMDLDHSAVASDAVINSGVSASNAALNRVQSVLLHFQKGAAVGPLAKTAPVDSKKPADPKGNPSAGATGDLSDDGNNAPDPSNSAKTTTVAPSAPQAAASTTTATASTTAAPQPASPPTAAPGTSTSTTPSGVPSQALPGTGTPTTNADPNAGAAPDTALDPNAAPDTPDPAQGDTTPTTTPKPGFFTRVKNKISSWMNGMFGVGSPATAEPDSNDPQTPPKDTKNVQGLTPVEDAGTNSN